MALVVKIHKFKTSSGNVNTYFGNPLPFLSEKEMENFNEIGYTRKLNGVETSRTEYLNTLNKGVFSIEQTKYDNGDFQEEFVLAQAYNE